ncbi:2-amino-4-hydroxy-6-hydroxymethyldihydropteridine diphosphokinase [Tabrizicola thermarum]|uniref:2-amino-4-hydroxy-6- hydroxymethyldihydropteridine diphosphokinase n=1 Tax=Tabrizicola thermarum TaxID=2670345 RepID=UPI001EE48047|nr:2-amino-4-hydroxy-6-hydroxymethyldihydropteridine diphosphokinase [Tabrizicola thermarum]
MHALVALGANLPFRGDPPETTLARALKALSEEGLSLLAVSRFFATPCFPAGAGPDYVNAAAMLTVDAESDATAILAVLHRVEERFGRRRDTRWGMRTLDIDLLALGDSVLPDGDAQDEWRNLSPDRQIGSAPDRLILPHPRLQDRAFVLVPLAEVAPDWVHPRTGQTVAAMLAALPAADVAAVKPL